ncbi:glycosyltransferase family 4 protein [Candidatus Viridilinea mediisalina]|uniref:Glycosyltransferase n=1 Tax=Candidatus Viridilinea mediisalina TaxID=2024553 RepID=A0A2A6RKT5_9CHLR|nr:glycosyltransferase family 4 protein [Candidatus Viridilinea mediisalina]PDW03499.1 hypothetical protein CJ255_08430 [Candidatus Viridilinea mediisalina]
MHILMICAAAPTTDRPRTHGLLTAMARSGHTVSVIFIDGAGTAFDELSDRCHTLIPVARRSGLSRRVIDQLARQKFDLAHVEGEVVKDIELPLPLPTVVDVSTGIPQAQERIMRAAGLLVRAAHVMQTLYPGRATLTGLSHEQRLIVANNEALWAYETLGYPAQRPEVVPTPVDTVRFKPMLQLRDHAKLLLDLRDFTPLERMSVLVSAHRVLLGIWQARPDVHMQVLGPPPPGALRALTHEQRIHFVGAIRDARPYLATTTLVLVPALPGHHPLYTPLEAMALGLPVLGLPTLARELEAITGHELVVVPEVAQMAQVVLTLLDDPSYCGHIGCAARRFVERRHRYQVAGIALENIYASASGCALAEWRLEVGFAGVVTDGRPCIG